VTLELEHLLAVIAGLVSGGAIVVAVLVVGMRNPLRLWSRLRAAHSEGPVYLIGRNRPFRQAFEYLTGRRLPASFTHYYLGAVMVGERLEVWRLQGDELERIAVFHRHLPVGVKRVTSQQAGRQYETVNVQVDAGDRTGWLWLLLAEATSPRWIRLVPPSGRDAFVRAWEGASEPAQT
jgi:hypothetical protein